MTLGVMRRRGEWPQLAPLVPLPRCAPCPHPRPLCQPSIRESGVRLATPMRGRTRDAPIAPLATSLSLAPMPALLFPQDRQRRRPRPRTCIPFVTVHGNLVGQPCRPTGAFACPFRHPLAALVARMAEAHGTILSSSLIGPVPIAGRAMCALPSAALRTGTGRDVLVDTDRGRKGPCGPLQRTHRIGCADRSEECRDGL